MRAILSCVVGLPAGLAANHFLGIPLVKELKIEKAIPFINILLAIVIVYCSVRSIIRLLNTYPATENGEQRFNMAVCFFVPSFLLGIFLIFAISF